MGLIPLMDIEFKILSFKSAHLKNNIHKVETENIIALSLLLLFSKS